MNRISNLESRISKSAGFTLIEIMIALSILAVGLLAIFAAQGNSLRASARAENIQNASLLGRQVMAEKLFEFQKEMEKGSFPDEKEENGDFEAPNENFHWQFNVRKVELPMIGEQVAGKAAEAGGEAQPTGPGAGVQAPEDAQKNLAQVVTKKISENVRELTLKIYWEELGEEQSFKITTHLSRVR